MAKEKADFLSAYYNEEAWGSIRKFSGVHVSIMHQLVATGEADPEETQNNSPSIKEFIDFADEMKDTFSVDVLFHGYRVLPTRDDVRVSLEGFEIKGAIDRVALISVVNFGRCADEFEIRDDYIRAWWD